MKIIKYYIDIGCIYECDGTEDAFKNIQCWNTIKYGLIGVLKLRLDTENKTIEEIFFKQKFSPYVHQFAKELIMDVSSGCRIFKDYSDKDMVVTWNGRDFDLPIILNNINFPEKYREHYIKSICRKDRDLLDLCILRGINVKGGLQEVTRRFKIKHDLGNKNIPSYSNKDLNFLTEMNKSSNNYNHYMKLAKHRNEFDVRILPLLEERLGYLFESRSCFDNYHKRWNT
jgi:hypothetical protein